MITTIDAVKHRVYVWLTRAESADSRVAEQLDALFAQYRGTKERVFVFRSGERNLVDCTAGLLRHNREVQAREEKR